MAQTGPIPGMPVRRFASPLSFARLRASASSFPIFASRMPICSSNSRPGARTVSGSRDSGSSTAAASRDGMVSVGGNLHSVPDAARKRVPEVQRHPAEVRIFEDRTLIARHPVLEGRNRRRVDPGHRRPPPRPDPMQLEEAPKRSLAFHDAVGRRLERQGAAR